MNDRMKAALIGGAVAGVLTVITSMLGPLGFCCFLWAIGGGVLSVFMYMKGAGGTMTPGDGAKLGLRAGIVAAIIFLIIGVPLTLIFGGAAIADAIQQSSGSGAAVAGLGAVVGGLALLISAGVLVGFTTLGGVIGAAIFGKGAGAAPPPPPPPPAGGFGGGYGNPPAGGGGYGGPSGGSYGQGT